MSNFPQKGSTIVKFSPERIHYCQTFPRKDTRLSNFPQKGYTIVKLSPEGYTIIKISPEMIHYGHTFPRKDTLQTLPRNDTLSNFPQKGYTFQTFPAKDTLVPRKDTPFSHFPRNSPLHLSVTCIKMPHPFFVLHP